MAFRVIQTLDTSNVDYSYDRERDVLYISFGQPDRSIAIQVEDWLALRLRLNPPGIAGITILGFRKLLARVSPDVDVDISKRVDRLRRATFVADYDDQSDTLVWRWGEGRPDSLAPPSIRHGVSVFEQLAENLYIEKAVPTNDFIGIKVLNFTKAGPAAVEALFGAIVDTIFAQQPVGENARLVTRAMVQHLDWQKLRSLAA